LLAFGISLYLFGRAITRELLFPLAFLFFMFPLPMAVLDTIAMPMKLFAASAGAAIVTLLGMPLVQEGFQLHFPTTSLVIDDPCSGLRSLISLAALGALCAYFFQAPTWKRMALFIAAIPIALISNILRVTFLASLAFHGKNAASGFYHDLSGIMVFLLALAMLFGTRRVLEWRQ
jgi:exosortase